MNLRKRQARAKARAKTANLTRRGVPFTHSRWHYLSHWTMRNLLGGAMSPGRYQSYRKRARRKYGGGVDDTRRNAP